MAEGSGREHFSYTLRLADDAYSQPPAVAVKEANGTFARQKGLTLGDVIGNDYVVLDGLKPGDHLIVSGTQFLQDGMPVAEQVQAADAVPAGKDSLRGSCALAPPSPMTSSIKLLRKADATLVR